MKMNACRLGVNIMKKERILAIGRRHLSVACASGFWGDTATSTPQLVYGSPKSDFIVYDFLSEITMSLLTAAKAKNPAFGYCPDFVQVHMIPYLAEFKKRGIRIVSNAGGINPHACAAAVRDACAKNGVDLKVGVVSGDDLLHKKSEFATAGLKNFEVNSSEVPFEAVTSLNTYFGAFPIAKALDLGADIVITGRCVDSALVLGPLIHSFKWTETDYDKLAHGSLAGHLVECGAQATGGIYSDWHTVEGWDNIGFPIVQFKDADATSFVLTKPDSTFDLSIVQTGGTVTVGSVSEQLVYEIADPENYLLPDVTLDLSHVRIRPVNGDMGVSNAVLVDGAIGKAPSDFLKVSGTYASGYRCIAVCPVIGPRAKEKGQKTADAILARCRRLFKQLKLGDFTRTHIAMIGSGDIYGPQNASISRTDTTRDVMLWAAVEHNDRKALELFSREIAPAGTGMAPGLTTIIGGRPSVSPILKFCSFLVKRSSVSAEITVNDQNVSYKSSEIDEASRTNQAQLIDEQLKSIPSHPFAHLTDSKIPKGSHSYRVFDLAFTRSGDKGNTANIGVVARDASYYPYLKQQLTAEKVANYFEHFFEKPADKKFVKRYELPGTSSLNFVLPDVLGGGGVASLRPDPQGKALGQMLMDFQLTNLPKLF